MPHINHDYNGRYNTIDYESSINLGYPCTILFDELVWLLNNKII